MLQATSNPRILCYILLARNKVTTGLVIQDTWGRHCDKLIFFGNYASTTKLQMTILNGKEGYPFLWNKTKSALLYLHENFTVIYYNITASYLIIFHNQNQVMNGRGY